MIDHTWIIVGTSISTVFSLATFIALEMTPEMKNVQGFICRCYLASYTGFMILLTTCGFVHQFLDPFSNFYLWTVIISGSLYFFSATVFWLNVMSFDVWITFRKLRLIPYVDTNDDVQDPRIVRYSIYAWGSSSVHLLIILACANTGVDISVVMISLIPIIGITICSIGLFISTALMIKQRERETADTVDGSDKIYQRNIQWFIRYVELIVTMSFVLILLAVAVFTSTILLLVLLGPLQSFITFVIFITKDEIKLSLREFFQRHSPWTV